MPFDANGSVGSLLEELAHCLCEAHKSGARARLHASASSREGYIPKLGSSRRWINEYHLLIARPRDVSAKSLERHSDARSLLLRRSAQPLSLDSRSELCGPLPIRLLPPRVVGLLGRDNGRAHEHHHDDAHDAGHEIADGDPFVRIGCHQCYPSSLTDAGSFTVIER